MSDPDGHDVQAAMRRLRNALDAVGDALKSADLDGLVNAEELMSLAVAGVPVPVPQNAEDAAGLRREVRGVRAALQRSRRLGAAMNEFAAFSLLAQGGAGSYTRKGKTESLVLGRALDARV